MGLAEAAATLLAGCALSLGGCAEGAAGDPFAEPVTLVATGGSHPTAAITPAGRVYTAWVGADRNVWLRASDAGAAVRVNDVPGDAAPHAQAPAQVATGPDGAVYVVWHNETPVEGRRFPASDLRFARSGDGGRTFEPAITVNDDAGGTPTSHTFQDLLVTSDGTVVVSWIDSRGSEGDEAVHPGHAAGGPPPDGEPRAAGGPPRDGQPHAAGGQPPPGDRGPEIRVARSTDGGRSFSASTVVSVDACPCCRTAMAAGPDGAVYLAWRHIFRGNVRDIVIARSTDGGIRFDAPRRVHEDGWVYDGCPHAGPSLAVTPEGTVHVAWYTGKEGAAGLFHAASTDGGETFGRPRSIESGQWVPPSTARLAVTGAGDVWLAWEDRRRDDPKVLVARVSADGGPGPVAASFDGTAPDMPSDPAGGPVLAYLGGEGDAVLVASAPRARP